MNLCFFVSDLHGKMSRYQALIEVIRKEKPDFVLLGGDLLPHKSVKGRPGFDSINDFVTDFMIPAFSKLKKKMECAYPEIMLIPGNDDPLLLLDGILNGEKEDLWQNIHNKVCRHGKYSFFGYACVPPTPFMLKDWEKFDIEAVVPEGSIHPADGFTSLPVAAGETRLNIEEELKLLAEGQDLSYAVFLFHSPPYGSVLDVMENQSGNWHAGSKAVSRFIESRQPYITLHGHLHESVRLSGDWKQQTGKTYSFGAAHDGPELALVKFELHTPRWAERVLITT